MTSPVTIIIPTFNNPQFLNPCVLSIARTGVLNGLAKLLIINNGTQPIGDQFKAFPNLEVVTPGSNLGWERGLQYGIEHSDSPFLVFQNDDTHIPQSDSFIYHYMLRHFSNADVAAVGPTTTTAAGWHSIYMQSPIRSLTEVSYLIFFTVMIRRTHLVEAGGIDFSCPGGDDIDLSIRLRKNGKKLFVDPTAFLIHHGFKTGERVRGGPNVAGGWNSKEMTDRTNQWLIQKHGFKTFLDTLRGIAVTGRPLEDKEGDVVRSFVEGERILELGCGAKKTVENAVGMDLAPNGEEIKQVLGHFSVADIVGDVSHKLPFPPNSYDTIIARHILEHCLDTLETLRNWNRVLRLGGRLIVAVPNELQVRSIPLNPEHVHAFSPDSLRNVLEATGFKQICYEDPKNGISFVGCYEKVADLAEVDDPDLALVSNGH